MDQFQQELDASEDTATTQAAWKQMGRSYEERLRVVTSQVMHDAHPLPYPNTPAALSGLAASPAKRTSESPQKGGEKKVRRAKISGFDLARSNGRGMFLWAQAEGDLPEPDFSMVKLLNKDVERSDGSRPEYSDMGLLDATQEANLKGWWQHLLAADVDNFLRWWNGSGAETHCLGNKIKTKAPTTWEGDVACRSCRDKRAKRPCFRLMDTRCDDSSLVRVVQVLPDADGSFEYWGPVEKQ